MGSYLPEEVVWNILKRLPAEDVHPLKMVCKEWCSLISDPNFIHAHLHYHRHQPPPKLFIGLKKFFSFNNCISITYDDANQNISTVDCEFSIDIPILTEQTCVSAGCDGLLLLLGVSATLYVCNSVTRRCSILPRTSGTADLRLSPSELPRFNKIADWVFVFDSSAKNYKIFGISNVNCSCIVLTSGVGEVTKEWSTIITLKDHQLPYLSLLFSGNQLHWAAYTRENPQDNLCTMDMVTKKIVTRLGPPRPADTPSHVFLAEVKGRVCFTRAFPTHLQVWLLVGTAAKDHWENHFTTCLSPVFSINLSNSSLCIVSMNEELKLFIHQNDKLFYFDFKSLDLKQIATFLAYGHFLSLYSRVSHFHFGSLVSWKQSN